MKDGLDNVEKQTIELTDDANQILESIQDLVTVEKIDDSKLIEEVGTAKNKTDDIVDKLHALDDSQAEALEPVFDRINTMKTFISELDSKFKRADVSVTSYDVDAIKDMEAYQDVTNRFLTYDEDIEERLFHDDPSYQVKNALDTVQSTTENMGTKAKKKSFLSSAIDTTVQTSKGIVTGGADFIVDTAVGAYDMVTHPIQTAQSIDYMIGHPLETGKYIGNAVGESFNRDR